MTPAKNRVAGVFFTTEEDLPGPYEAIPLHGDEREIGGRSPLQPCPYRRAVDATPGVTSHYECDCAGGIPVGARAPEDRLVVEICGSCNIPSEIDPTRNHRSCLFLIPVRLWIGCHLQTGFSCRWFYNFKPKRLPREAWQCCLGCPHWFPRPSDEASIPRMSEWIHRIIRLYWEPEPAKQISRSVSPTQGQDTFPPSLWIEALSERAKKFQEVLRVRRTRRTNPVVEGER